MLYDLSLTANVEERARLESLSKQVRRYYRLRCHARGEDMVEELLPSSDALVVVKDEADVRTLATLHEDAATHYP